MSAVWFPGRGRRAKYFCNLLVIAVNSRTNIPCGVLQQKMWFNEEFDAKLQTVWRTTGNLPRDSISCVQPQDFAFRGIELESEVVHFYNSKSSANLSIWKRKLVARNNEKRNWTLSLQPKFVTIPTASSSSWPLAFSDNWNSQTRESGNDTKQYIVDFFQWVWVFTPSFATQPSTCQASLEVIFFSARWKFGLRTRCAPADHVYKETFNQSQQVFKFICQWASSQVLGLSLIRNCCIGSLPISGANPKSAL